MYIPFLWAASFQLSETINTVKHQLVMSHVHVHGPGLCQRSFLAKIEKVHACNSQYHYMGPQKDNIFKEYTCIYIYIYVYIYNIMYIHTYVYMVFICVYIYHAYKR